MAKRTDPEMMEARGEVIVRARAAGVRSPAEMRAEMAEKLAQVLEEGGEESPEYVEQLRKEAAFHRNLDRLAEQQIRQRERATES